MFLSADISQNALLLWPHQWLSSQTDSSSYSLRRLYVLIQTHVREPEHYVRVDFTLLFTIKACMLAGAQDGVQLYAASAERRRFRGSNSWSISWNKSEQLHLLPDDHVSLPSCFTETLIKCHFSERHCEKQPAADLHGFITCWCF